jgi:hypothetical protein
MPAGWHRTHGFNTTGQLMIGTGTFLGSASDVISVDWAGPDELLTIDLGQQGGTVQLSGHDLRSLLASAAKAFPGAAQTRVTIGGEPGWRLAVGQASYVLPLANLAITWHDGTAYAFEEHLVLDGSTSGQFGDILQRVTFP